MSAQESRFPLPLGGTAVGDFLYPGPAERRAAAIIRWWERRRLSYNLIVGGSGLISLTLVSLSSILPPNPPGFRFVWFPIIAYGLLANLCYSLGPATELAMHKLWGRHVLPSGPVLFRTGVIFSVGVTLGIPLILLTLTWVFRILGWLF